MTAEKSIKILKAVKELKDDAIYTLTDLTEAYKMAIEALSKQSASCKQVDKSVIVDFVAFQREWLKTHKIMELNSADEVMTEIFLKETGKAFIDSLGQSGENDEADQFREDTKKTDSERVSLSEQEKSNSFSEKPSEEGNSEMNCSDVPDIHVGKTDFKLGGNPGIIHCKDCKKFVKDHFNIPYCYRDPGCKWNENDYCSKAERRNDG